MTKTRPYTSGVLFTSGLDSLILYKYIKDNIDSNTVPIFYNIGSKYNHIEKEYVLKNKNAIINDCLKLGHIEQDDAHINQRNVLLATMAVAEYSNTIYIGGTKSDRVSDNNETYANKLSELLTYTQQENVSISSPFYNLYKDDIIDWYCGHEKDAQTKLLFDSFSCFTPMQSDVNVSIYNKNINYNSNHCFTCGACFRRNSCLYTAGIALPFFNDSIIDKYKKQFECECLSNRRAISTLKYINFLMK